MRPVTRGNPASYPLDYLTGGEQKVADSARTLQTYVDRDDLLRQQLVTINGNLTAKNAEFTASELQKRPRSEGYSAYADSKMPRGGTKQKKIITDEDRLTFIKNAGLELKAAYDRALTAQPFVAGALKLAATDLIQNTEAELDWYKKHSGALESQINTTYGKSRGDLIKNIGQYCSYCEMPLAANLAVEHMLPKADFPLLSLTWTNFLLACSVCNGHKNAKPSRDTGKQVAITGGAQPPLTNDSIQDGALSTYLWPNDATGYANWQTYFAYVMKKVIYDNSGKLVSSADIPRPVVASWGTGLTRVTMISESGYAIRVRFLELLGELLNDYQTAVNSLRGLTIPDPLKTILSSLPDGRRLDFDNATPQLTAGDDPVSWWVKESRHYRVNAVNQKQPVLPEIKGTLRTEIEKLDLNAASDRTTFYIDLDRGVLPKKVADILTDPLRTYKVNPKTQSMLINHPESTIYDIEVKKTIFLVADGTALQVFSLEEHDVELHLVPTANSTRAAEARQVIADVELNRLDRTNTKFSDRRMVKRTKTWFVALESVHRMNQTLNAFGQPTLEPAAELKALIELTAVSTGYWSVWREVFNTFLMRFMRKQMTDLLLKPENFPGTR